jgi:hypothetical protein
VISEDTMLLMNIFALWQGQWWTVVSAGFWSVDPAFDCISDIRHMYINDRYVQMEQESSSQMDKE